MSLKHCGTAGNEPVQINNTDLYQYIKNACEKTTVQNIYMTKFNTSNAKLYWPNLTTKTTQTCRFSTGPNSRVYIPALRLSVLPKLSIIKAAWKKLIDYGLSNYAVGHTSVGLTGHKASRVGKKMGGGEKKKIGYNRGGKGGQEMFLGGVIDRLWSRAAWREAAWPQRWPWQLLGAPISPLDC